MSARNFCNFCLVLGIFSTSASFASASGPALAGKDLLCHVNFGRVEAQDFDLRGYSLYRFSSSSDGMISVSHLYIETDMKTHELGFNYTGVIGIKELESTYRYKEYPNVIIFGDMRKNILPGLTDFEDVDFDKAVVSAEDFASSVRIGRAMNAEYDGDIFRLDRGNLVMNSISGLGNVGLEYSCSLLPVGEYDSTLKEMESQYEEFYKNELDNLLLENAPTQNKI